MWGKWSPHLCGTRDHENLRPDDLRWMELRRRSLAEAKRSELCSPRRSAALRPRPSGRRPGSRCGDGTRCSPVRPSENGRTLMCVTEAAHAACARRAPASLGAPPTWPRPGGLPVPAPRFSPGALSAEPGVPARGGFTALTVVVVSEAGCGPPRSLAGSALRAARNPVCLQTLRIHVSARLSFQARLPGLIFGLWAVPP